jgi:hypothetical protein
MGRLFALFLLGLGLCCLSLAAHAQLQPSCNLGTLKGRYIFTGRGFIEAVQPGIPRVHYGFFEFDGAGKLTGRQSSSRGGKIGREDLQGIYTVNADCSGTITLGGIVGSETHWDFYLTDDQKRGHMIRMDEGNMAVRSFEK